MEDREDRQRPGEEGGFEFVLQYFFKERFADASSKGELCRRSCSSASLRRLGLLPLTPSHPRPPAEATRRVLIEVRPRAGCQGRSQHLHSRTPKWCLLYRPAGEAEGYTACTGLPHTGTCIHMSMAGSCLAAGSGAACAHSRTCMRADQG